MVRRQLGTYGTYIWCVCVVFFTKLLKKGACTIAPPTGKYIDSKGKDVTIRNLRWHLRNMRSMPTSYALATMDIG